jgi:hypothetical protein
MLNTRRVRKFSHVTYIYWYKTVKVINFVSNQILINFELWTISTDNIRRLCVLELKDILIQHGFYFIGNKCIAERKSIFIYTCSILTFKIVLKNPSNYLNYLSTTLTRFLFFAIWFDHEVIYVILLPDLIKN